MKDSIPDCTFSCVISWLKTWLNGCQLFVDRLKGVEELTVRDVIQKTGLSASAVYKKIKAHGMSMESVKDQKTGHFTPEAEKQIAELFNLDKNEDDGNKNQVDNQNGKVDNQAEKVDEKLTIEVERLRIRIEALENQIEQLTGERDYLRQALAATLNKVPPALPSPGKKRGLFGLFGRKRGGHDAD